MKNFHASLNYHLAKAMVPGDNNGTTEMKIPPVQRSYFVDDIFDRPQIYVSAVTYDYTFRQDNVFDEMSLCDLVPGRSNSPVNRKFIDSFDKGFNSPIFGRAFYERSPISSSRDQGPNVMGASTSYSKTLEAITSIRTNKPPGMSSNTEQGDESIDFWYANTNYNPNVFYYPMNFRQKPSAARANEKVSSFLDVLQKTPSESKYSAMVASSQAQANLNQTMFYQEFSLTPYSIPYVNDQYDPIKDSYTFGKAKLINSANVGVMSFADPTHNPVSPIKNESQIIKEDYRFDIHEEYDDDVQ
jgi:hypothetical protein